MVDGLQYNSGDTGIVIAPDEIRIAPNEIQN